jgi:transposase
MPGVPERQTHDYVRNGTTNLYAALDVASGKVISEMRPRHPRFTLQFTPTYSSWLNLVERWFAELTTKWLKRGSHRDPRQPRLLLPADQ